MEVKELYEEYHEQTSEMIELLDRDNWSLSIDDEKLKEKAHNLSESLRSFGIKVKNIDIIAGPSVSRFEVTFEYGRIKISEFMELEPNIQMALEALSVRIIAPIPGKAAIGIECPNEKPSVVRLRSLLETDRFKDSTPLTSMIGRGFNGEPICCDIAKMPHLLIAGSTGSGKSICLNSILISILCKALPDELKLIMYSPNVVELSIYNGIPHLIMPVVTDVQKAINVLKWAASEMERRYHLFVEKNVRDLEAYNEACKNEGEQPLPLLVCVIDEFADLMMVASKEVEAQVLRLAAKARAAGIHLILATQRPYFDVITGVLRNNLPSRIALAVTSAVYSKSILGEKGAEKLIGSGDMLYSPLSAPKPIRVQGAFVSDEEAERVVGFLKNHYEPQYDDSVINMIDNAVNGSVKTDSRFSGKGLASLLNHGTSSDGSGGSGGSVFSVNDEKDDDDLLISAVDVIIEQQVASVSILQRKLGIGFPHAARLIDILERKRYIGPFEGSRPRRVLINAEEWARIRSNGEL